MLAIQNEYENAGSTNIPPPGSYIEMTDGSIVFDNGAVLPRIAAQQLRQLGASLLSYNKNMLEAAERGCAVDCRLIDDPNGVDFFDDLELSDHEKEEDDDEIEPDFYRARSLRVHPELADMSFVEREEKRKKKHWAVGGTVSDKETSDHWHQTA